MCGIFSKLGNYDVQHITSYLNKIQHRGPDNTMTKCFENLFLGFHRLSINGLEASSNQPLHYDGVWVICNGEIYNFQQLIYENKFNYNTNSDCEIIIHMYIRYGIKETCKQLDGVFAFVLYDSVRNVVYVARDHLGIRPLYYGVNTNNYQEYVNSIEECNISTNDICFASEAKAITYMNFVEQFPPRCYWSSEDADFHQYYFFDSVVRDKLENENIICRNIKNLLTEAVRKRFVMSDVEVGCLLSGGLDSSLVTAICSKLIDDPKNLKTFSIGLENSPDLENAQMVADLIGTNHHNVVASEQEFLDAIEETIYCLGSYDITTIRASVGHRLISKYVNENTDVKVLFSGEVADEMGSYLYLMNAPNSDAYQEECFRLLNDIHLFDGLRSDRSISYNGIESRVPFSDKAFVKYYMGIHPTLRMFNNNRIEKYLIRKAFSDENLLPESVLWRRKNGFSDSVSSKERSWSVIINEYVDTLVSDEEFSQESIKFTYNTPKTKEAYYYRKIFNKYYKNHNVLTPYMWLPKWCGEVDDPSARVLEIYKAD